MQPRRIPRDALVAAQFLLVLVCACTRGGEGGEGSRRVPDRGPLAIFAAGDTLLTRQVDAAADAGRLAPLRDVIRKSHVAIVNLENNLLEAGTADKAAATPPPRWPYGAAREVATLRGLGVNAVSLANDHTADYGGDGIESTIRSLDAGQIAHAGAGHDLAAARAPAFIGGRRVAVVSVTASSLPDARATAAKLDVAGRPGVNPLRATADITVDRATYAALAASASPPGSGRQPGERELTIFGARVRQGEQPSIGFNIDANDAREVLDYVRAARGVADVVVVALHTHEPSNISETPAEAVREFAKAAIDAGAALVVCTGPHRVRGLELYKQGAIFYSLGNFIYQTDDLDFRAANMFDRGADLYRRVIAGQPESGVQPMPAPDDRSWWEGLAATITVDARHVTSVALYPIDVGAPDRGSMRGVPAIATGTEALEVLQRVTALSAPYHTAIDVRDGIGRVQVGSHQ